MTHKNIYLDHAATTPIDPAISRLVAATNRQLIGNPSSLHSAGRQARQILEAARGRIATVLGCKADEVTFTSSGTEANNLALLGIAHAYQRQGNHIIISAIEHHSVLRAAERLEQEGFEVTRLPVDPEGLVDPAVLKNALRPDTILVSIIYANNEIGTIQPIRQFARIIQEYRKKTGSLFPIFHTDACQAAGDLSVRVHDVGVDLMTLNSSKIYGPRGIACLYHNRSFSLTPMLYGGSQERGLHAGTENVGAAVGFAAALEQADHHREQESGRLSTLRDYCIEKILTTIPKSRLNGSAKQRLANNINISFDDIDGEMLMLALDQVGIAVSTGSACTSHETGPSHVLRAINPDGKNQGNIRITLGRSTKQSDINYLLKVLPQIVAKLRAVKSQ